MHLFSLFPIATLPFLVFTTTIHPFLSARKSLSSSTNTYLPIHGSGGPYLELSPLGSEDGLKILPLDATLSLLTRIAASIPARGSPFVAIDPAPSPEGLKFVLETNPNGRTATQGGTGGLGEDVVKDAVEVLKSFFEKKDLAFQSKLRIVDDEAQKMGEELVRGNLTRVG